MWVQIPLFLIVNLDVKCLNFKIKGVIVCSRKSVVTFDFVGKRVGVYSGRRVVLIDISRLHVGHYFGEFVRTRICNHKFEKQHKRKYYEIISNPIRISK